MNYELSQYKVTRALVERSFAKRTSAGSWDYSTREFRRVLSHAKDVTRSEAVLCPYCTSEMIVHNKGKLVPPHFEHKCHSEAVMRLCPALLPNFREADSSSN